MLENLVGGESAALATRNRILDDPIDLFENLDSTRTQLLHEYFNPRDSLEAFLVQGRKLIPAHAGELLNLTVRRLRAYPMADAFVALKCKYDPEEIFQNKFYQEYGHPF